ncbi:MAG: hypothetical protein DRI46_13210 [Chloroflexi bacterium]|nr:MAG: hypothetical protein DRI46_13210 [Chloroflexota bacterium]
MLISPAGDSVSPEPITPSFLDAARGDCFDRLPLPFTQLLSQLECRESGLYDISPVIGTHVGPGTVGIGVHQVE